VTREREPPSDEPVVEVIEHEGVITSERAGLSPDERNLVRWMEEREPEDEPEES
jgi:hypothetical protein